MTDLSRQVAMLERENERLREENARLRRMQTEVDILPPLFGLTGREDALVSLLLAKEVATKDQLHFALYGHEVDGGAEPKIIDVFICKIRKKLKPFGIEIGTMWGRGYRLDPEMKARMRSMCEQLRGRPAADLITENAA